MPRKPKPITANDYALALAKYADDLYDRRVTPGHISFVRPRALGRDGQREREIFEAYFADDPTRLLVFKPNDKAGSCFIYARADNKLRWPEVRQAIWIAHEFAVSSDPAHYEYLIKKHGDNR